MVRWRNIGIIKHLWYPRHIKTICRAWGKHIYIYCKQKDKTLISYPARKLSKTNEFCFWVFFFARGNSRKTLKLTKHQQNMLRWNFAKCVSSSLDSVYLRKVGTDWTPTLSLSTNCQLFCTKPQILLFLKIFVLQNLGVFQIPEESRDELNSYLGGFHRTEELFGTKSQLI